MPKSLKRWDGFMDGQEFATGRQGFNQKNGKFFLRKLSNRAMLQASEQNEFDL
jgi:hypothetical protein